MTDTLHVYLDNADQWRWSYLATNGAIVGDSGQGYDDRRDALHGFAILNRVDLAGLDPREVIDPCPRHTGHRCLVWAIPRVSIDPAGLQLVHDDARTVGTAWLKVVVDPDDQVVGYAVDPRKHNITVTDIVEPV